MRPDGPADAESALRDAGAEVVRVERADRGLSWDAVLEDLAAREVMSVLLEGGSGVLTSGFEAGIIAKLFLVYAPLLIGGSAALSLCMRMILTPMLPTMISAIPRPACRLLKLIPSSFQTRPGTAASNMKKDYDSSMPRFIAAIQVV